MPAEAGNFDRQNASELQMRILQRAVQDRVG